MANYLLKKFSDRSYNIDLSRTTLGEVRLLGDVWNAQIRIDGKLTGVRGYAKPGTAFHAVILLSQINALQAKHPEIKLDTQYLMQAAGSDDAQVRNFNWLSEQYVAAYNSVNSGYSLRVVQPRRRRR